MEGTEEGARSRRPRSRGDDKKVGKRFGLRGERLKGIYFFFKVLLLGGKRVMEKARWKNGKEGREEGSASAF